jgi:hypothetical protein
MLNTTTIIHRDELLGFCRVDGNYFASLLRSIVANLRYALPDDCNMDAIISFNETDN